MAQEEAGVKGVEEGKGEEVVVDLIRTSCGIHSLGMSRWTKAESGMEGRSSCMIILTAARSRPRLSANRTIFFLRGEEGGDFCAFNEVLLMMLRAMVLDIKTYWNGLKQQLCLMPGHTTFFFCERRKEEEEGRRRRKKDKRANEGENWWSTWRGDDLVIPDLWVTVVSLSLSLNL